MFENEAQAIEALVAEANAEPASSVDFAPPSTPQEPAQQVEQGAPTQDSNNADPEEERLSGLRLADYTQKTQQIAPLRKFMEQNGISEGNLSAVQQAWDFASQLQANPLALYEQLGSTLAQHGLLQQGGAPQSQFQQYEQQYEQDFESGVDLPPHVQAQLQQLTQSQSALQQQIADMRAQADFAAWQYAQHQEENAVRQMNPNYGEEDWNFIHEVSGATGGQIGDANNLYQRIIQHALGKHIETKSTVPNAVTPPRSLGHATVPLDPNTMSVDDAHNAAMELLAQLDSQS